MYNIDSNYLSNREDIKNAYDSCVVHADALIDFYNNINASLSLDASAFSGGKLNDDAKYIIYYCREKLQAISVEFTQMCNLDDKSILSLVMILRQHCKDEMQDLINLRDIFNDEKPTLVHAAMHYFSLTHIRKNHIAKLTHYYDSELNHAKDKNNKGLLKNYRRMTNGNSITHFFDDVIALLNPCLDDVKMKYEELVGYDVIKLQSGGADFNYVFKITRVNFEPLLKIFYRLNSEYQSLKETLKNSNPISDLQVNARMQNIESQVSINDVNISVAKIRANIMNIGPNGTIEYSFDIINVLLAIMKMSNMLEQGVVALRKMALVQMSAAPASQTHDATCAEIKPQVATIHHVEVAIEQPLVVAPVQAPVPAFVAAPVIETEFERTIQKRIDNAVKGRKTLREYQQGNLQKAMSLMAGQGESSQGSKLFDRDVLVMFFTNPTPHFKMTEKDYIRFMRSIGASVNESTGNGSSVKITLDPKSVLIAPGQNLSSTAMNMHKQHQSGHSVKTIPAFVIKNSLEFFKRAGLYEYLYEENQKYLHPSAAKDNSACTM